MDVKLPSDCGNAPRLGIVGQFAVSWAEGDTEGLSEWLADEASWKLVGRGTYTGDEAVHAVGPPFAPERIEVLSVITHGRLASCDGYLEAEGRRIDFSHAIHFASTSKTAKIAELRSYCIESGY